MIKSPGLLPFILIAAMQTFFSCDNNHPSPEQEQMVRLAKLVIDSTQLESYKAALKEEIEASVRLEPGVLTLEAFFTHLSQHFVNMSHDRRNFLKAGATKPAHLQENLWSADIEFTPDELKGISEDLSKITVVGDRYTGQAAQQVRN